MFTGQEAAAAAEEHEPALQQWAEEQLHGRHLNEVIERPTAELFAMWAYEQWTDQLPGLAAVRVAETRDTSVTYREDSSVR